VESISISLTVNGVQRRADVEPRTLLVSYLRDDLALTGAHIGCETSQCGACTILMDGQAVKSCTVLAAQADGSEVTTIEGLAPVGMLHPVQRAFWDEHGLQCGFCTPGMVLSTVALLADDPDPDEVTIRHGLEGNICRCTGYHNVVLSVRAAAQALAAGAVPEPLASRDTARGETKA
jgi:carbon-monoxide dehydrogenase small subunit